MADSRQKDVWSNHALEQWEENKTGHDFSDNSFLRKWVLKLSPEKALDLGCGGGLWRKLFTGFDYTGVDQNENMVKYARKRWPKDVFVVSDGETTPFDDESFDLVFTSAVLQHNRHERKSKVVEEIYRLLKPGGTYLCTENTFREDNYKHTFPYIKEWNKDLDDGYSFTPTGWESYMSKFGFKLVWFEKPSEYLYVKEMSV